MMIMFKDIKIDAECSVCDKRKSLTIMPHITKDSHKTKIMKAAYEDIGKYKFNRIDLTKIVRLMTQDMRCGCIMCDDHELVEKYLIPVIRHVFSTVNISKKSINNLFHDRDHFCSEIWITECIKKDKTFIDTYKEDLHNLDYNYKDFLDDPDEYYINNFIYKGKIESLDKVSIDKIVKSIDKLNDNKTWSVMSFLVKKGYDISLDDIKLLLTKNDIVVAKYESGKHKELYPDLVPKIRQYIRDHVTYSTIIPMMKGNEIIFDKEMIIHIINNHDVDNIEDATTIFSMIINIVKCADSFGDIDDEILNRIRLYTLEVSPTKHVYEDDNDINMISYVLTLAKNINKNYLPILMKRHLWRIKYEKYTLFRYLIDEAVPISNDIVDDLVGSYTFSCGKSYEDIVRLLNALISLKIDISAYPSIIKLVLDTSVTFANYSLVKILEEVGVKITFDNVRDLLCSTDIDHINLNKIGLKYDHEYLHMLLSLGRNLNGTAKYYKNDKMYELYVKLIKGRSIKEIKEFMKKNNLDYNLSCLYAVVGRRYIEIYTLYDILRTVTPDERSLLLCNHADNKASSEILFREYNKKLHSL